MADKNKPGHPLYKKVVLEGGTINVLRRRETGLKATPYTYYLIDNVADNAAADTLITAQKLID